MTATENIIVLAVCCAVAYMVGKKSAEKAAKPCNCAGATAATETTDAPDSMQWFQAWAGLK
jgi:hypothetical protein